MDEYGIEVVQPMELRVNWEYKTLKDLVHVD